MPKPTAYKAKNAVGFSTYEADRTELKTITDPIKITNREFICAESFMPSGKITVDVMTISGNTI